MKISKEKRDAWCRDEDPKHSRLVAACEYIDELEWSEKYWRAALKRALIAGGISLLVQGIVAIIVIRSLAP